MGKETGISWTDHTFNPWWGCTKVSPGCDNCYAEAFDKRVGGSHWGKGQPRRTFTDKHWNEPLAWNRAAEKAGRVAGRARVPHTRRPGHPADAGHGGLDPGHSATRRRPPRPGLTRAD